MSRFKTPPSVPIAGFVGGARKHPTFGATSPSGRFSRPETRNGAHQLFLMTRPASPIVFEQSSPAVSRVAPLVRSRFRALVQSPLRASLVRHFHTQPERTFDLDELVQIFGRLRVDVENCVGHLVEQGFARICSSPP